MTNLDAYYAQQAGTGIAFYPGVRYQRGHGFFGRFFKGNLLPLLQSLGHKLLSTGVDVADDVINNDVDPMTSLKRRGRAVAKDSANEFIAKARDKLTKMKQSGAGRKKRKSIKGPAKKKKRVSSKKKVAKETSKRKTKKKTAKNPTKPKLQKKKKKVSSKAGAPKFLDY
jgi:hypothetical protein